MPAWLLHSQWFASNSPNRVAVIGFLVASIVFLPSPILGQELTLAGNYDGTNYDFSSYDVGFNSGYTVSWGADFTVAGNGDYDMTKVILPLMANSSFGGIPNPANYQISVVSDVGGKPVGAVVGSLTPIAPRPFTVNYTFDISGVLHGGMNYWLLFGPVAPDNGCFEWNFSAPWQLPGVGNLAERWSSSGVPTGNWAISAGPGSVQPAFVIQGTEVVPEPGCGVLFGLGLTILMIRGCLCGTAKKNGSGATGQMGTLPIANRRYGRLQTCATGADTSCAR